MLPNPSALEAEVRAVGIAAILGTLGYALSLALFEPLHARLIGAIIFMVALWTNEGLPLGVVSLLPLILFPALNILPTDSVSENYAKSIIFLFLGGFLLAIAVEKTGLHQVIAGRLLSVFPNTPRGIIFSLALTSAALSSFLSNTTTALLLLPIGLFLTQDTALKLRFVLAISYGASIGGIVTPIGTPPNLILLGFVEEHALPTVSFFNWMIMTLPLAVLMLLITGFVLSFGIEQGKKVQELDQNCVLSTNQRKLAWLLLALITLLLVNSPIKPWYPGLGLNEKGILLFFGLLMFAPGFRFLEWSDSKKIPFEIIFLFGAGFSIAAAFSATGLAGRIADSLMLLQGLPTLAIILIVASLVTFTTEITSNTALISIVLPIIYALASQAGMETGLIMMVATICASYAFMLPIATPPNAIAMSSGAVKVKQMASYGLLFNLLGITLITLTALFYWRDFY